MIQILTFNCRLILFFFLVLSYACTQNEEHPSGKWRAIIHTQGQEIPFEMEINNENGYQVKLINGEEVIAIDTVIFREDSLQIPMHIFDASIIAKFDGDSLHGYWVKHYLEDYKLKFSASQQEVFRFKADEAPSFNLEEKYAVEFYQESDTTRAVGLFEQNNEHLAGTFLTATGDYRFLVGVATGDSIKLSAFDGSHAFLFKAAVQENGHVRGVFYSGKTGYRQWQAIPDPTAAIADADTLTQLNEGFDSFSFSLPNLQGDTISDQHPKFDNKVTIVQILGSWCPNCMDETRFLAEWYREHQDLPVEIVGLAFEAKDDFDYAQKRLNKMVDKFDVDYPILIAGADNRENINDKLPMLDRLKAFPSTIFIDKKGEVRKIHTGFSGPGTGEYYDEFVNEFNSFVQKLAKE